MIGRTAASVNFGDKRVLVDDLNSVSPTEDLAVRKYLLTYYLYDRDCSFHIFIVCNIHKQYVMNIQYEIFTNSK